MTGLVRTDAITQDDARDSERRARAFRRRIEREYAAGRLRRRRVEYLGTLSNCRRHLYFRDLLEMLVYALAKGGRPEDIHEFRKFCRVWIRRGAPIDPKVLWIPTPSLQIVLRQTALAFPSLGRIHADARLWLTDPFIRSGGKPLTGPMKYPKPFTEFFIPFNLCLYAPRGTPYATFNRTGFAREWVDLPDNGT